MMQELHADFYKLIKTPISKWIHPSFGQELKDALATSSSTIRVGFSEAGTVVGINVNQTFHK